MQCCAVFVLGAEMPLPEKHSDMFPSTEMASGTATASVNKADEQPPEDIRDWNILKGP